MFETSRDRKNAYLSFFIIIITISYPNELIVLYKRKLKKH